MGARAGFTFWIRGVQALALAVAVCFSMGATDAGSRTNNLSHRLMCQCGCAQLLGECDHVGCPDRDKELGELSSGIASGASDQQILDSFVAKYGAVVLVAWIAPFAVLAAALLGTILLVRRWGGLRFGKTQAAVAPASNDPADLERRERIRRETGGDGGF